MQNKDFEVTTFRSDMIQDKGIRAYQTLHDVEMDILGAVRKIKEVRVSYTRNADGTVSRCLSFDEYQRIADEIHRELRRQRKVYSERE
jgi:hypothetical protein